MKFQLLLSINRSIFFVVIIISSCSGQERGKEKERMKVIEDFTAAAIDGASNETLIEKYLLLSDSSAKILE